MWSLGFSKRFHVPLIRVLSTDFYFWKLPFVLFNSFKLNPKEEKDGTVSMNLYGRRIKLLPPHAAMVFGELRMWEKSYLPVDLKGKVVLDVGAGCGETAIFYLKHGAEKVIAIEPNPKAFELLKENLSGLNVEAINTQFNLSHLQLQHDFMKMDGEGCEKLLLSYEGEIKPCVIEAHSFNVSGENDLGPKLAKKFNLKMKELKIRNELLWS